MEMVAPTREHPAPCSLPAASEIKFIHVKKEVMKMTFRSQLSVLCASLCSL